MRIGKNDVVGGNHGVRHIYIYTHSWKEMGIRSNKREMRMQ
jgi:hypothetical protein